MLLVLSFMMAGAGVVWHTLGTTSVNETPADAAQRAEIRLMSARGPITNIRMQVLDGTVTLERIVVTFAHGSTQTVDLNKKLDAGAFTRDIEVTGNDHVIRKVAFLYTAPKFANVHLYGH